MLEIKDGEGGSFPPIVPYSLLAIDFGEITGVASFTLGRNDLRCASTDNPFSVFTLIAGLEPDEILLERFPDNPQIPHDVEHAYRNLMQRSVLISPGSWKPFMKNWKRSFPQAKTQHEKDAISILRYHLLTTMKRDV